MYYIFLENQFHDVIPDGTVKQKSSIIENGLLLYGLTLILSPKSAKILKSRFFDDNAQNLWRLVESYDQLPKVYISVNGSLKEGLKITSEKSSRYVPIFAYGGNMSLSNVHKRGVYPVASAVATLENYSLTFNKKSWNSIEGKIAYANIEEMQNSSVEGVVHIITKEELQIVDGYEGYPFHYSRQLLPVKLFGVDEVIESYIYRATDEYIREGLNPPKRYLDVIEQGRKEIETLKETTLKLI
jgi:hypothetical protein